MKITALLASAILIGSTQGQSHIREVDVAVSSDPNRQCEMFPPTGTLSVKICGEHCCFMDHIGGIFAEGVIYTFREEQLEECRDFNLGTLDSSTSSMTLFHFGTDSICINNVRLFTTEGQFVECRFNDYQIDGKNFVQANDCLVV